LRSGIRRRQYGRGAVHAATRLSAAVLLACAASAAPADTSGLQPAGSGRLTWFGIQAYEAKLWVAPGFRRAEFDRHALALELNYLRDFSARDIARRSVDEMRRAGPIAAADAQRWQEQLQQVLPDVRAGDRILGLHRPGRGASFLVNGRAAGEIADANFSARFFGIWLAPVTSEPKLRDALLATTPP
jgi:hypothetical protein